MIIIIDTVIIIIIIIIILMVLPYPPSWQEIPIFPGTQPESQLPVTGSQRAKQLQRFPQSWPQRLLGQSVDKLSYQKAKETEK